WAVIAPWNFPYALMGAPAAAALLAGNTVVMKPSSETPLSALKLCAIFEEAGLPPGTISCVTGGGRTVGDTLVMHPQVDGVTRIGDPLAPETFVGPLATRASYEDYQRYVAQAGKAVRAGGEVLRSDAFANGYFARPTILTGLPADHALWREELFVPIVAVQAI